MPAVEGVDVPVTAARPSAMVAPRIAYIAPVLALFAATLMAGCDTHRLQDSFADEAARPPQGFTETSIDGELIVDDADDWRTSPAYRGRITVDPAFPNPVSSHFVNISLTVIDFETVGGGGLTLRAYDADGTRLIALDQPVVVQGPGSYTFSFTPGLLSTKGLHRVFIFDLNGEIVSYGDVMVQ